MGEEKTFPKNNCKPRATNKEAAFGCGVLIAIAVVLYFIFGGGDPSPVDAGAPRDKQLKQAEKIYESAYYMARTALNEKFGGKLPDGLKYGLMNDCVISWMSFDGPNNFRVKMAISDTKTGRIDYVFVDLVYHGDGKWNVIGFEDD